MRSSLIDDEEDKYLLANKFKVKRNNLIHLILCDNDELDEDQSVEHEHHMKLLMVYKRKDSATDATVKS